MLRKVKILITVTSILLASAFSAHAMNFDAETLYESIFVVSTESALGSGFAIGNNIIITNEHVIEESDNVAVSSYSGEDFSAEIFASNSKLDIAVLVVKDAKFIPLKIGDEEKAKIGDDIYTVGAPHSLAYTLTKGVISAKDREFYGQTYIQIDAAINSGNSGGPLLNESGEVLGVNTLKMQGSDGIGLSIPMSRVVEYIKSCGITFGDDNSAVIGQPTTAQEENTSVPEEKPQNEQETENSEGFVIGTDIDTRSIVLAAALAVSVIINIFLIIFIIYKKNSNKYVVKTDPSERMDFEIEIEE